MQYDFMAIVALGVVIGAVLLVSLMLGLIIFS
jgi:hypothetical protein